MSDYSALISGTAGLLAYNRLAGAASPIVSETGNNVTFTGATPQVAGALVSDTADTALSFDGVNDFGALVIDLSGTNIVTLECWVWWDAYANDDDFMFEYSTNQTANGFVIDPNQGGGSFSVAFGAATATKLNHLYSRTAIPAAQWNHLVLVIDKTQSGAARMKLYANGALLTLASTLVDSADTTNFANSTLYFVTRTANQLFGACKLDELALYNVALTSAQAQAHYYAGANRRLGLLGVGG